ncbi:MAG: sigma-70 family RNA polymerase sigma factor [Tepidisphaeraceae bacterium]|jgi:RNA polymerase sigma factor (sigma-70 family)
MQDRELLTKFAQTRSQDAFAELVRHHMDSVYSAARRQVRDGQLAEDVAQAVFIILARKAQNLKDRESLAGWLMKTTRLACLDALKAESRRRRHEQRAASLAQSRMEQAMSSPMEEVAPELDRAMSRLAESDRSAVTLRYLQGKTTSETAECLGISQPAAAKRIFRAVHRLRKILLRSRAIAPAVALAAVLDQIPRVPAPAALAASAATAATTGAAAPAALAIAKGVLHVMTFHKILAAMLLIAALAGVTGIGVGTVKLLADQTAPPPATPPAAQPAPVDLPPISSATLSNGVSIQILGISESPPTGKQWWLANGDLLDSPPYTRMATRISLIPGCIAREIVVAINDSVNGSTDHAAVRWFLSNSRGSASSFIENKTGKPIPHMDAQAVALPDSPAGATLHADVAAGKWNTVGTASGIGGSSQSGPNGSLLFSNAFVVNRQTHIVAAYSGLLPTHPDVRLVAIDRAGNIIPAAGTHTAGNDSSFVGEYFVMLPPNSIRQWQMQTRPFNQWIEIRGISLHPGVKANVTTVTSDDQPNP